MKYLVKKADYYLNCYKCGDGVSITDFYWYDIEYAMGFDSIADAQEWANLSGGTVVLPIVAYSQV